MPEAETVTAAVARLRDPRTIRARAGVILERAAVGHSPYFEVATGAPLDLLAEQVAVVTRDRYPDLNVPLHSRWRHFVIAGANRWTAVARPLAPGSLERARAALDLAVVSVLLDAGAGEQWRYDDAPSGARLHRSEGLAAASLDAFAAGAFSGEAHDPLRVDARGLASLSSGDLDRVFQVSAGNPLVGIDGRLALLHELARALQARPALFGPAARPGHLVDALMQGGPAVRAAALVRTVLEAFSAIWPGRQVLAEHSLGDVWPLAAAGGEGPSAGLMPLHKLSQWLTYSLVEPLGEAGIAVTGLDELTGLAEYRNGGLFIDGGVLALRDQGLARMMHPAGSELIVEWRALTVALLDAIAPRVRAWLGPAASKMPLGAVLEGGTWAAGRRLARERRADGSPPLRIESDGTVF